MTPAARNQRENIPSAAGRVPATEALFWEPAEGGKVRCTLCPHLCVIAENEEGLCKARGVRGGRLMALTYARPATIVSDEIEKKPLLPFPSRARGRSLWAATAATCSAATARTGRSRMRARAPRPPACRFSARRMPWPWPASTSSPESPSPTTTRPCGSSTCMMCARPSRRPVSTQPSSPPAISPRPLSTTSVRF